MTFKDVRAAVAPLLALALFSALPSVGIAQTIPGPEDYIADAEPPSFSDPGLAVDALKKALADNDAKAVATLLGLDAAMLPGNAEAMDTLAKIRDGAAEKVVVTGEGDERALQIGRVLWPFPFPLKNFEDGWAFDTFAGIEEIIDRRIGENELQTIATMNQIASAQQDYAGDDRDGDGVLEFAQRLVSAEGQTDGLYWPAEQGVAPSPAGGLIVEAQLDKAAEGRGYYGYKYKVLNRQGENIAGGAYDYVVNGNMISGHAVIAWPAVYGQTGVHTFLVSHHGIVYEADLGEDTAAVVEAISSFNPGDLWTIAAE